MSHGLLLTIAALIAVYTVPVVVFSGIGYVVEQVLATQHSGNTNRWLNSGITLLFLASKATLGLMVSVSLSQAISKIPRAGFIHVPGSDRGNLLVACALVLLINILYDFFQYWAHRLEHVSKWLWAEHEIHHADENMNATTTYRHHWIEPLVDATLVAAPASFLFTMPTVTVSVAYIAVQGISFFIHLNAKIELGWFSRIIANPQCHRIHHSRLPEHVDKNFAVILPLWDILFGTYYHPAKGECPPTGLVSGEPIASLAESIFRPFFTWNRLIAEWWKSVDSSHVITSEPSTRTRSANLGS